MLKLIANLIGAVFVMTTPAHAQTFTLSSTAFSKEKSIPIQYSCDGKDVSPPLSWQGAPAGTKSFALVVSDPDAPGGTFYHWVLFNIPGSTHSLAEGERVKTSITGKTSWGKSQYNGPCPPKGSQHHYIFTLYALDTPQLTLSSTTDAATLLNGIKNHIIGQAELTGIYKRK